MSYREDRGIIFGARKPFLRSGRRTSELQRNVFSYIQSLEKVFVDTSFLLARTLRHDQWHESAKRAEEALPSNVKLFISFEVLGEFLSFLSRDKYSRSEAAKAVEGITSNRNLYTIIESNNSLFLKGFHLYRQRLDKEYSYVDCVSMAIMRDYGIHTF